MSFTIIPQQATESLVSGEQHLEAGSLSIPAPITDSLVLELKPAILDSVSTAAPPIEAHDIFGVQSFIPESTVNVIPTGQAAFTGDVIYQLLTVCLLIIYCYAILNHKLEVGSLFKIFFTSRRNDKITDDHDYMFVYFIKGASIAGYLMFGIAMVRVCEIWAYDTIEALFPKNAPLIIIFITIAVLAAIAFVQRFILWASGALTYSAIFVRRLLALKRVFLLIASVTATPLVLLLALAPLLAAKTIVYCLIGLISTLVICYIYRSLKLFIEEKVSIFFWILYLYAVETMPFGILILAALRSI